MKTIALGSFIVLFAIIAGITTTPTAFADHMTAAVSLPSGTSVPGCTADVIWSKADIT